MARSRSSARHQATGFSRLLLPNETFEFTLEWIDAVDEMSEARVTPSYTQEPSASRWITLAKRLQPTDDPVAPVCKPKPSSLFPSGRCAPECVIVGQNRRGRRRRETKIEKEVDPLSIPSSSFCCGLCAKKFTCMKRLESHADSHLRRIRADRERKKCAQCDKMLLPSSHQRHVKNFHRVARCQRCRGVFVGELKYRRHPCPAAEELGQFVFQLPEGPDSLVEVKDVNINGGWMPGENPIVMGPEESLPDFHEESDVYFFDCEPFDDGLFVIKNENDEENQDFL